MLDLTLTGVDEAIDRIRSLADRVHSRIGSNARQALEPVAEEARRIAPVDSGDYRDSIVVSDWVPNASVREQNNMVYVGPLASNVYYAWFLEFGTVNMPPHPVIIPALEAKAELVFEILGKRVGEDFSTAHTPRR